MTDIRVTQAGRFAATQEDADVRVTQAGRFAVTQEDADVRVTQAGRFAATPAVDGDLRVTAMGRVVMVIEPAPSMPVLITPVDDGVYAVTLFIVYNESTDPLEGTITYSAQMKLSTDTVWTTVFEDELYNSGYAHDISGLTDGTYDFRIWAETLGYSSQVNSVQFTVHNGMPTAPTITAPYEGQEWTKTSNTVEWEAAVDPDDDPITYDARYKKVSASTWTSLFTGETGLDYIWNQSAFDADDYELEVWADDGVGPGPSAHVYFSIITANQPNTPRIRIVEIGTDYIVVELGEYSHPFSVAWNATKWEIMPFGGSWANPTESTTVTDSGQQLLYTFTGLPPGFRGVIRATFQDANLVWGNPSAEVFAVTPGTTTDWERRWERNAAWYLRGLGIEGRAGDWGSGWHAQPISAIVDPDAESMGSFKLTGYVMAGGCYCGWIGKDTELRRIGVGVFRGDSVSGGQYGIFFGIEFGIVINGGAHYCKPCLYVQYDDCILANSKTVLGDEFIGYSQVTAGKQPLYGQPIGPWVTSFSTYPVYRIELWVQRDLSTQTARARGRISYRGWESAFYPSDTMVKKTITGNDWDIDYTFPCLTPCGQPGFYQGQYAAGISTAYGEYYGLSAVALRDLGQTYVVNVDPLIPYEGPGEGPCTPVSEDPLPDPVFFPAPPNGDVTERWMHPSDLIAARDDSEQRISLRDNPVAVVSFTATLLTSREVTQLKALIWDEQPSRWGVPMWMDAARLDEDLTGGAGSIPAASVDTYGRRFEEATHVAIWKDQFTWDFLPATLNPDGSITLTGTTTREYYAFETYVIPCRIGRMEPTAQLSRPSPAIGDMEVKFTLEAVDG